jgi:geranylgeranyl diphosphate synthase type II
LLGDLFAVKPDKLWSASTAIELIHAASLVMDDLPYMEDSQLRRGKPANHVVFGQDVALLSSVGLISRAVTLVMEDPNLLPEEQVRIGALLAEAFGFDGLVAGQFVDLKLKRKDVDFSIIEFISRKKNTALLTVAAQIAAALAHAPDDQTEQVVAFANHFGFALQLAEELEELDASKDSAMNNIHPEKLHLVSLLGEEQAVQMFETYLARAKEDLNLLPGNSETLQAFLAYLVPERKNRA